MKFDAFNQTVWRIVRQVPHGKVTTYGQIASMIPCPPDPDPDEYRRLAPRWVGDAMNQVSRSDDPTIPWQRVINGKGGISMSAMTEGGKLQRQRLRAEGILFDAKERVNFHVVGWTGPNADWLEDEGLHPPHPLTKDDPHHPQQMSLF